MVQAGLNSRIVYRSDAHQDTGKGQEIRKKGKTVEKVIPNNLGFASKILWFPLPAFAFRFLLTFLRTDPLTTWDH